MNSKPWIILSLLICGTASAGGGDVRNGGNATVCYRDTTKKKIVSIEMFDYWEGARAYSTYPQIDLGGPNLSVKEKIDLFISRVSKFESDKAARYQDYETILLHDLNAFMVDRFPGGSVDDDAPLVTPKAPCYKEQFAVQIKNPVAPQRRFEILRSFYQNALTTNDTRAGILLHEIVYRDAIENFQQTQSNGARRANYFFAGTLGQTADAADRKDMYDLAGIEYFKGTFAVRIFPYNTRVLLRDDFKGSGTYYLRSAAFLSVPGFEGKLNGGDDQGEPTALHPNGETSCNTLELDDQNGKATVVGFGDRGPEFMHISNITMNGKNYSSGPKQWIGYETGVYPNGRLKSIITDWSPSGIVTWSGKLYPISYPQAICRDDLTPATLDQNGNVTSCDADIYSGKPFVFNLPQNQTVTALSSGIHFGAIQMSFYPNGNLHRLKDFSGTTINAQLVGGQFQNLSEIEFDVNGNRIQ